MSMLWSQALYTLGRRPPYDPASRARSTPTTSWSCPTSGSTPGSPPGTRLPRRRGHAGRPGAGRRPAALPPLDRWQQPDGHVPCAEWVMAEECPPLFAWAALRSPRRSTRPPRDAFLAELYPGLQRQYDYWWDQRRSAGRAVHGRLPGHGQPAAGATGDGPGGRVGLDGVLRPRPRAIATRLGNGRRRRRVPRGQRADRRGGQREPLGRGAASTSTPTRTGPAPHDVLQRPRAAHRGDRPRRTGWTASWPSFATRRSSSRPTASGAVRRERDLPARVRRARGVNSNWRGPVWVPLNYLSSRRSSPSTRRSRRPSASRGGHRRGRLEGDRPALGVLRRRHGRGARRGRADRLDRAGGQHGRRRLAGRGDPNHQAP